MVVEEIPGERGERGRPTAAAEHRTKELFRWISRVGAFRAKLLCSSCDYCCYSVKGEECCFLSFTRWKFTGCSSAGIIVIIKCHVLPLMTLCGRNSTKRRILKIKDDAVEGVFVKSPWRRRTEVKEEKRSVGRDAYVKGSEGDV